LLAFAFVVTSATPSSAETWICSYPDQAQVILSINGGLRIEQRPNPILYNVLENNEAAIIAEAHHGGLDPTMNDVVIFISTVTIDKRSNKFTHTTALSGSEVQHRTGQCRGYDEGLENSGPALIRLSD
jgi:hypothetical protein